MKLYFAAAGALLIGTSAMAWAPAKTVESKWAEAGSKISLLSPDRSPNDQMKVAVLDALGDAKAEQMGLDAPTDAGLKAVPASWDSGMPKLQPAAATFWSDDSPKAEPAAASWSDKKAEQKLLAAAAPDGNASSETADIRYGEWPTEAEEEAAVAAKVDLGDDLVEEAPPVDDAIDGEPPMEDDALVPASPPIESGVGGPDEIAATDLTPRPAAGNYPPCDPGPGDDNCIQLYEPGVRTALASWNAPTGGLDQGTATAMGGPYEAADDELTADASEAMDATKPEDVGAIGGGK